MKRIVKVFKWDDSTVVGLNILDENGERIFNNYSFFWGIGGAVLAEHTTYSKQSGVYAFREANYYVGDVELWDEYDRVPDGEPYFTIDEPEEYEEEDNYDEDEEDR